jgi:hypothetical protein
MPKSRNLRDANKKKKHEATFLILDKDVYVTCESSDDRDRRVIDNLSV